MGPLLLFVVSPCFREIVFFVCVCSLENLLQKNVVVFFFENQISQWRSFEKKGLLFTYFSHFVSYQGHTYIHSHTCILLTLLTFFFFFFFCLTNFEKIRIYQVWFLFGVIPGVDSYSRHFGTINK